MKVTFWIKLRSLYIAGILELQLEVVKKKKSRKYVKLAKLAGNWCAMKFDHLDLVLRTKRFHF